MADRPILFSGPMIRALLQGRKSQTRRVLTKLRRFGLVREFGPSDTVGYDWHFRDKCARWQDLRACDLLTYLPFAVGDRLWVREAWHAARSLDSTPPRDIPRDADIEHAATARSYAEIGLKGKLRPGMFMPRWASRLTLEVTDVRVQRLQDITPEDARDEGVDRRSRKVRQMWLFGASAAEREAIYLRACPWEFEELWNGLNAERGFGWDVNPWVVAVSFEVRRGNIDQLQ